MKISDLYTEDQLMLLTEKYIAIELLKLNKIWDCGHTVWEWRK